MPTYEYLCRGCGHRFEQYQTITAQPVKECPECGAAVERLLGAGAAILSKASSSPSLPCGSQGPCCGQDSPCMRGMM